MRFNEFKLVEQAQAKFYTIGDSHAEAVATAGGRDWVNLAIGGRSSTDAEMLANIAQVPRGAVVLVSQGANDTANAMRAYMDSKGARPLKKPQEIARNVAAVVDKVQAQGATVIFMLFPNGPGRGAGLAKYYGGDYQEEVRSAIKAAIGNVKVIDINGKPLTDGVHATMGVYKDVANQVRAQSGSGVRLGNTSGKPGAPTTKDKGASANSNFVLSVPEGRRGPEIRDIQQVLIRLGYELPKHGADGIRGPETVRAVMAFQKDNGLEQDGDPGFETVKKLNSLIAAKPELVAGLQRSTNKDVKATQQPASPKAMKPLSQDSATQGKVGDVLNFIARYESGGNYNIILGGKTAPLTSMTIAKVFDLQQDMINRGMESSAVGRYQYIGSTLRDQTKQMGIDPAKIRFDEKTQDRYAIYTLRTRADLDGWLGGSVSDEEFLNKMSKIWAAIPNTKTGGSFYAGVGSNKAGMNVKTALSTLQNIKTA